MFSSRTGRLPGSARHTGEWSRGSPLLHRQGWVRTGSPGAELQSTGGNKWLRVRQALMWTEITSNYAMGEDTHVAVWHTRAQWVSTQDFRGCEFGPCEPVGLVLFQHPDVLQILIFGHQRILWNGSGQLKVHASLIVNAWYLTCEGRRLMGMNYAER